MSFHAAGIGSLGFALCALPSATGRARHTFYVSPHGNDSWSGTLPDPNARGTDGPFASLERARMAVREAPKDKR